MPRNLRLFVIGLWTLSTEMFLIRWIGTEVRIFAYLQNAILMMCFAGLGIGCSAVRRRVIRLTDFLLPLTFLTALLTIPYSRRALEDLSTNLTLFGGLHIWFAGSGSGAMAVSLFSSAVVFVTILLWLISIVFIPLGQIFGDELQGSADIVQSYSANLIGSLAGLWLFLSFGWFYFGPICWLSISMGLACAVFIDQFRRQRLVAAGIILLNIGLVLFSPQNSSVVKTVWSPYQKITLLRGDAGTEAYSLQVNKVYYQSITPAPEIAAIEQISADNPSQALSKAARVLLHPDPKKILIVGAGAGDTVSTALSLTSADIVAVEIDPAILDIGKAYHPDHPYSSDRVKIVLNDARSYFSQTSDRFDMIIFDFLDAHTTASYSNIRLDHFVYTLESFTQAQKLLNPGGIEAVSFAFDSDYIRSRIVRSLEKVFGRPPVQFGNWTLVAGDTESAAKSLERYPHLNSAVGLKPIPASAVQNVEITTDDWPYLYLEKRSVPPLFFLFSAIVVAIFFVQARQAGIRFGFSEFDKVNWHFFLLGAAFMLLETTAILRAAVVYGNTWVVNAVVISGILVMALAANILSPRLSATAFKLSAFGLIGASLLYCVINLDRLGLLTGLTKHSLVALTCGLPVLFSGLIFINGLRVVGERRNVFGFNLFGSILGGMLANLSLFSGMQFLAYVLTAIYFLAILIRPKMSEK